MATRKRRHTPPIDSLGVSRSPSWIVAVDSWGKILDAKRIEPGSDLYAALVEDHLRYHREGWSFDERMFFNKDFHVRRPGDTPRRVFITSLDPASTPLETDGEYSRFGWEFRAPSLGMYGHGRA